MIIEGTIRRGEFRALTNEEKANLMADEFCSVFTYDDGALPTFEGNIKYPMNLIPWFYEDEVYELLQKWPMSHAVTPDFIRLFFIKKIAHVITKPLAYIFNQSVMFSGVPKRWKHSFVTPILKKEPAVSASNYRPVSVTSLFCRVFEKLLKKHIIHHLEKNSLIPVNQHGFVSGRSVETNMLISLNDWTNILDSREACNVIYFDFSKAFDRVSHAKLIY